MPDPTETASTIAKAKELGLDPLVTVIVMVGGSIISFLAWLMGERGKKKMPDSEADITAALARHEEQKMMARAADDVSKVVTLLIDINKILGAVDRGQRETHVMLEAVFNSTQFSAPPPRRHRTEDAG